MGSIESNIQDFFLRCKLRLAEGVGQWGLYIILILVGFISFGLGRLSALEDVRPPVSITTLPILSKPQGIYPGGLYVASRTGGVYYYPWCAGAQNIAPESQVWFSSSERARAAGYQPAKSCKGLE
jgi:hypothetical protein